MQALEKILEEINQEKLKHWDSSERLDTDKLIGWCFDKCIDIIRKHMNDGWIPVERRLPINHEGDVEVTVGAGYRTVGYYDQYREEWWTLDEDSILDVIAWKEPSEPYSPERNGE